MFNNIDIDNKEAPKISVVVRKRPLSRREAAKGETDIIGCRGTQTVVVKELR